MQVTININGEQVSRDVEPRQLLVHFIRDTPGPDRHALGLRHLQLRRVRGADGRPAGQVVHDARGDVRGPRDPDRRVARGRRPARPGPAGLPRDARAPVRLLHPGDADDEPRAPGREPESDRRGDPHRDLRRRSAGARATRTSSPRSSGPPSTRPPRGRRSEDGHGREPPEHGAGAADRLRAAEAQGGRALHPRQGQLPGRHPAAGHGARRGPAQPLRARAHPLDRHEQGARPPGRGGGGHRQGPRDARARVDADDLLRHAGGARGRQGPLPGPGGRVRDRDRRVHRPRRAPADRRRVRAAARGRQRAQGARPGRAADPRRQDRPDRQPRQPDLGGRRRGGHGPRVRGGRHGRDARHHLSALPPGAARDVRHDRGLQPADRAAQHLQRQPGAARAPDRVRAGGGARRAHDPDPDAATSAAGSATRCPSIPATYARSPARSWPACRSSGSRTARRT